PGFILLRPNHGVERKDRPMMRWLTLVGLLVTCAALSSAEEPRPRPVQPEQPAPPSARRFDREKLLQFRQRFGGGQLDLSKLKRVTWQVGDLEREALVYVPPGLDKSTKPPLVFAFHGHGGRAE